MTNVFIRGTGHWTRYRKLLGVVEVDLQRNEAMYVAKEYILGVLKLAYENGTPYVLFIHGWSNRPRTEVRKVMRSKDLSSYLNRRESIEHESVFVATIKFKEERQRPGKRHGIGERKHLAYF